MTWQIILLAALLLPAPAKAGDSLSLVLNLPAYRLDLYSRAVRIRSYPVAIGMPRYPTPTGQFAIERVVWQPWWIPPESDWAKKEKPTPPGPRNPLGPVKLIFAPLYGIHGTIAEASIGRAASHGCVRLKNADAIELALLAGAGPQSKVTRWATLPQTLPLTVQYVLVEVRDGNLEIHPDVYRQKNESYHTIVLRVLSSVIDQAAIRHETVDVVVRRAGKKRVVVPLDSLRVWLNP